MYINIYIFINTYFQFIHEIYLSNIFNIMNYYRYTLFFNLKKCVIKHLKKNFFYYIYL